MKSNKQFIAYFLLLCLAITLLPSNPFHTHEEEVHHCELNAELEKNACHVRVYHSEYQEERCEHNHHFSKASENCDFCKYISSRRQLITFDDYQIALISPFLELPESKELSFIISNTNKRILGRAPPVI